MNASEMSKIIREKKKKMEADHSDAVKLSGIPMDATDMEVEKNKEEGEMLSENHPKAHEDGESETPAAEMNEEHHEQKTDDDDVKKAKMAKIGKMMSRMK